MGGGRRKDGMMMSFVFFLLFGFFMLVMTHTRWKAGCIVLLCWRGVGVGFGDEMHLTFVT